MNRLGKRSEEILRKHGIKWYRSFEYYCELRSRIDFNGQDFQQAEEISQREIASILQDEYGIETNKTGLTDQWRSNVFRSTNFFYDEDKVTAIMKAVEKIDDTE